MSEQNAAFGHAHHALQAALGNLHDKAAGALQGDYSSVFIEYNDWKTRYLPPEASSDPTKIIVKTVVQQPRINPVDINYGMFLIKGEWKVYDIMIDGVSLVTNYRSNFTDKIQRKGSLSVVIDDLDERIVEALAAKGS